MPWGFRTVSAFCLFFHSAKPLCTLCLSGIPFPWSASWTPAHSPRRGSHSEPFSYAHVYLFDILFICTSNICWVPAPCHIFFVGARYTPVNTMNSYTLETFMLLVGKKYIVNRSLKCVACHHRGHLPEIQYHGHGGIGGRSFLWCVKEVRKSE